MSQDENLHTTNLNLIRLASSTDDDVKMSALNQVLHIYMGPLRKHLAFKFRLEWNTVEDLVNGFVTDRMVASDLCRHFDSNQGRFRSFLLKCLDNYAMTYLRKKQRVEPIVDEPAQAEPVDVFQIEWARNLLNQTIETMKVECSGDDSDRQNEWIVFNEKVLNVLCGNNSSPSHDEIAAKLNLGSRRKSENLLITAKRRFQRCLKSIIEKYTTNVDTELQMLRQVISSGVPLHLENAISRMDSSDHGESLSISVSSLSHQDLSSLLDIGEEVREKCNQVLAMRVVDVLGNSEISLPNDLTIHQSIFSQVEIDILHQLRRHFRRIAKSSDEAEAFAAKVIYLAAIAAAIVVLDTKISKSDDKTILKGMDAVIKNGWSSQEVELLMQSAITKIEAYE